MLLPRLLRLRPRLDCEAGLLPEVLKDFLPVFFHAEGPVAQPPLLLLPLLSHAPFFLVGHVRVPDESSRGLGLGLQTLQGPSGALDLELVERAEVVVHERDDVKI